jgi:hypothetical protein
MTVEVSGGSDVAPFTASVTAPLELAAYYARTSLSRDGYNATWAANDGTRILIIVAAIDTHKDSVLVTCHVPDTGFFTIPASTFALIPRSFDRAILAVSRVAEAVQTVGDAHIAIDAIRVVGSGPFSLSGSDTDTAVAQHRSPPSVSDETSPHLFLSFAFGFGGVSRIGDVPPTGGGSWRLQLGQHLGHRLHLVEEMNTIGTGYISAFPMNTTEEHLSMGAGVRWTPLKPSPRRSSPVLMLPGSFGDIRSFTVTAVVGADLRTRSTQTTPTDSIDETAWSPMVSLAVGVDELRGGDWSLGPVFREQLAYFDGHVQRGWMLLVAIHLNDR